MDFLSITLGIAIGCLGNFLFMFLLSAFVYCVNLSYKRRFRIFWGTNKTNQVTIVLSNWFNTSMPNTNRAIGFITSKELALQNHFKTFFEKETAFFRLVLSKIGGEAWIRARNFLIEILPSPLDGVITKNSGTLIIIGSAVANGIRSVFVKNGFTKVLFENEIEQIPNSGKKMIKNNLFIKSEVSTFINNTDPMVTAYIERCFQNGRTVFMIGGFSGDATSAAVLYFIANWELYYKKFANNPFVVALGLHVDEHGNCNKDSVVTLDEKVWER